MDSITTTTANNIYTATITTSAANNIYTTTAPTDYYTQRDSQNTTNFVKDMSFKLKSKDTVEKMSYHEPQINFIPYISKIEVLCSNKVIRFTFSDGTTIKTICGDNDTFDFRFAFFLAYAKHFYNNFLTPTGIEQKAKEFENIKVFNTLVNKGMKVYLNDKKEEEKTKAEEKERKEIKARQAAKKAAKKAKKREARIKEMTEAIKNVTN